MKVCCSSYSFHRAFDKGIMDIESFLKIMYHLKVGGVELLDLHLIPNRENLRELKRLALRLGIEIAAITIHPSLEFPSISPYKCVAARDPLGKIKKWIDLAFFMGSPILRVDVLRTSKETTEKEAIRENIDCIKKSIPNAIEKGITMGIENHGGTTSTAENILKIVKGVDSEWYGVVLDVGNFGFEENAYEEMDKLAPYAILCHAKTYEFGLGWQGLESYWEEKKIDYRRVMGILRRNGFNGYLSLEYEGQEAEETAVPKGVEFLRKIIQ